MGTTPNCPPAEDTDMLSATNSEVESSVNHRHRRAILHGGIFSEEAFNAFNSGHAYIRAAQDGLARAMDQMNASSELKALKASSEKSGSRSVARRRL